MCRKVTLLAAGLGLLALDNPAAGQAKKKVTLPVTGSIQGPSVSRIWYGNNGPADLRMAELPLKLEARQKVTVVVTVVGSGRTAIAELKDPTDEVVGGSKMQTASGTRFTIDETSTAGTFTLLVGSNRVGDFTVVVNGTPIQPLDLATLEDRLKQLKAEIADVEAKIKKLKDEAK